MKRPVKQPKQSRVGDMSVSMAELEKSLQALADAFRNDSAAMRPAGQLKKALEAGSFTPSGRLVQGAAEQPKGRRKAIKAERVTLAKSEAPKRGSVSFKTRGSR